MMIDDVIAEMGLLIDNTVIIILSLHNSKCTKNVMMTNT